MARRVPEALIASLLAACCSAVADAPLEFGAAPSESAWTFTGDRLACRLVHEVPDFGETRFVQEAGGSLAFDASSWRVELRGEADVRTRTPAWIAAPDEALGHAAARSPHRLVLGRDVAEAMLRALYRGQFSNVTVGDVSLTISAVGFRPMYDRYSRCVAELLPASFAQLERSTVLFSAGKDELDAAARARLDRIVEYVRVDKTVARIYVDAYTDSSGLERKNRALSERRAQAIAEYLAARGFDRESIETRYHGSRFAVAANDTPEGRAQNRRATVRLERRVARVAGR